ncbi:MAG: NAD(P)H-hydrate dehydratase [Cytophagales bacterium]|nr:NAD(P)H-hydrate dehydratase [Rhizobacter sp.]
MERILPGRHDWPLHSAANSRLVEQQVLSGAKDHALMRRAGAAVAALSRALHPHARSVWVLCGPGNNGGDGLEAAMHLLKAGLQVEVTLVADPARLPSDARDALTRAQAAGVSISAERVSSESPDFAIDALLGIGSNRAPDGALAKWIDQLNALACPVLAVDLPSGLNSDTGQPHGGLCVEATHTLALLTLKPGLFTGSGRDLAGDVWLDRLGVKPNEPLPSARLSGATPFFAPRRHAQHKGSFGDVAVVGGASGMVGATLLAARAAHAAGAGRVYVNLLDEHPLALDVQRPELMFRPAWWQERAETLSQATVVCGCGGGEAMRTVLPRLLSSAGRLVLDADALNVIAADDSLQQLLAARALRGRETVLTPHPLEAARLLNTNTSLVQADRLAAAQQLAERFGSVVVLKGSGSVIAAPGSAPWINPTGSAALATAGTGDVLAGWLGGSWSASGASATQAARHTTWLHGRAADLCLAAPLRAADLIEAMHAASIP